jgi:hypothetical protein
MTIAALAGAFGNCNFDPNTQLSMNCLKEKVGIASLVAMICLVSRENW